VEYTLAKTNVLWMIWLQATAQLLELQTEPTSLGISRWKALSAERIWSRVVLRRIVLNATVVMGTEDAMFWPLSILR
jgi:hypothetical protein